MPGVGTVIIKCYKKIFGKKDPPPPPKKEETHFIKFSIVDDKGAPLPLVTVHITLPDGAIEEATSDKDGKIEIKNIKPGKCKVEYDWKNLTMNDIVMLQ
jgi:hypothetical protein